MDKASGKGPQRAYWSAPQLGLPSPELLGAGMAQQTRLRTPPIHEALIDLSFVGSTSGIEALEQITSSMKGDWAKKEITETTATFEIVPQKASKEQVVQSNHSAVVGYYLEDPTGHRILQVREDRLTVSHVRKYTTWEALEADAHSALIEYARVMKPSSVSRIAGRFINRIALPEDRPFEEFLTNPPKVVEGLGNARVTDFVRRQVIQGLDGDFVAVLNVGTATPLPEEKAASLLVDIDVF